MTEKSLAENIYDVGTLMAENLVTMGVTGADADDGLTTLAGKILDIPPTPVGVKIDTWTDLSSSASSVSVNQSFTVSGLVGAYHDDEVIDFIGYLKGATVKIYNGNVLLGSATTDNNGEFTYTVTPTVAGTMSLKAEFETIDDYTGSVSSTVSVEVTSFTGIDLTSNKSILSYVDGDTCTLSAQLVDASDNPVAIEGVTVTFKKGTTSLGTANTNSSGVATMTYTSAGVGDISLTAEVGMIVSVTYELKDYYFYNSCTTNSIENHWNVPSSVKNSTYAFSDNGWTFGNVSSFTRYASTITLPSIPYELSFKVSSFNRNGLQLEFGNNNNYYVGTDSTGNLYWHISADRSITYTVNSKYKLRIYSDHIEIWADDTKLDEVTATTSSTQLQFATGGGRSCTIKDLAIKPL